ncbi:MAG: hypothetical protein Q9173_003310 [Seirophora scorigena]
MEAATDVWVTLSFQESKGLQELFVAFQVLFSTHIGYKLLKPVLIPYAIREVPSTRILTIQALLQVLVGIYHWHVFDGWVFYMNLTTMGVCCASAIYTMIANSRSRSESSASNDSAAPPQTVDMSRLYASLSRDPEQAHGPLVCDLSGYDTNSRFKIAQRLLADTDHLSELDDLLRDRVRRLSTSGRVPKSDRAALEVYTANVAEVRAKLKVLTNEFFELGHRALHVGGL